MIRRTTLLATGVTGLLLAGAPLHAEVDPAVRQRVLDNIARSQQARASSNFREFANSTRGHDRQRRSGLGRLTAWLKRSRHLPNRCPGTTAGPAKVPHLHRVSGNHLQPSVLFDKSDRRVKRYLLRKAGSLRLDPSLDPWAKVERVQKVIRQRVSHSGNELSVEKNPTPYTRFNHRNRGWNLTATLGDYLSLRKVVCREFAFLTQAALETAGVESRLVRGTVKKNGKVVGGHAWNEIKVDDRWYIVDTTNPQFNRVPVEQATSRGTANGWIWTRDRDRFRVFPNH